MTEDIFYNTYFDKYISQQMGMTDRYAIKIMMFMVIQILILTRNPDIHEKKIYNSLYMI